MSKKTSKKSKKKKYSTRIEKNKNIYYKSDISIDKKDNKKQLLVLILVVSIVLNSGLLLVINNKDSSINKLNDNLPREWTNKLITLLVETNKKRNDYINKNILLFDQEVSDKVIAEYDEIIKEAEAINKKDFNKYYGQDESNLIKRLKEYKENYLLWVLRFDVPFSNNLSERSLRSSKTKMKVSGQFANIKNAEYYARIKSYIETCKSNGINFHIALKRIIEGNPYTLDEILNHQKEDAN